jgi:hypothetical protein
MLQRRPAAVAPPIVHQVLASAGRPLEPSFRGEMEARFVHDFSQVRVHADARAAASARAVGARAYAVGSDVVLGAGGRGRETLAHELAHTVQQRGATTAGAPIDPGSTLETAAAAAGRTAAGGGVVAQPLGRSGLVLARQPRGDDDPRSDDEILMELALVAESLRLARQRLRLYSSVAGELRQKREDPGLWDEIDRLQSRASILAAILRRRAAVAEGEAVAGIGNEPAAAAPEPQPELTRELIEQGAVPATAGLFTALQESREKLEDELAPPRDPRSFDDRLAAAKAGAPPTTLAAEFPDSVWAYGVTAGLFAEYEYGRVHQELTAASWERAEQEAKHDQMMAAYRREQEFEAIRFQLNAQFIQAALMGGASAPAWVRVPYTAIGIGQSTADVYQGIRSGDPTQVVGAVLPLAAGYARSTGSAAPRASPSRAFRPARPVEAGSAVVVVEVEVEVEVVEVGSAAAASISGTSRCCTVPTTATRAAISCRATSRTS